MRFLEPLAIAGKNVRRRKIRTFLSSFAVFIGIALLSTMVSLGFGVQEWLTDQITGQMEYTRITVSQKGTIGSGSSFLSGGDLVTDAEQAEIKPLTQESAEHIKEIEHVTSVEPMAMIMARSLRLEGQENYVKNTIGAGWDMAENDPYTKELLAGSLANWNATPNNMIITKQTLKVYERSAEDFIGKTVTLSFSKTLGGAQAFLASGGEEINFTYTVVAVVDAGLDTSNFLIPLNNAGDIMAQRSGLADASEYFTKVGFPVLYVNTDDLNNTETVAQKITDLGYEALTVDDLIGLINRIFIVLQAVLAVFALIALFISALGIINTMIMAIYERTKEIGLLKAVGAKKGDIRSIFMTESGFIGFLGGIFGTTFGYIVSFGITKALNVYLTRQGEAAQDFFAFPFWLMAGSIAFAVILGVLAGLYPAAKAANLDPIEALRYE